tara:strand:+ start:275 stop:937 length:663 start_codon:yes stop_codon:yes gene_type:complete
MKNIAMIPARAGSKRLPHKNLLEISPGTSLIEHQIKKLKSINCFDEIWVNSDSKRVEIIANNNKVHFYKRSKVLADDKSTSEDYIYDFIKNINCNNIFQVHSIAPLLKTKEIEDFVNYFNKKNYNTLLSYNDSILEHSFKNNPINFSYKKKQNSQDLLPLQKINWAITGWNSKKYIDSIKNNKNATFSSPVGYFRISKKSSLVIKDKTDFQIAKSLLNAK